MNQTPENEDLRQRCLLYLLGELEPAEQAAFESELADPAVADALERESLLLSQLATTHSLSKPISMPPVSHEEARPPLKAIVLSISALAATLLLAFGILWTADDGSDDPVVMNANAMELKIARAWAQQTDWVDLEDEVAPFANDLEVSKGGEDIVETPQESIDWMVAAMEASFALEENDG